MAGKIGKRLEQTLVEQEAVAVSAAAPSEHLCDSAVPLFGASGSVAKMEPSCKRNGGTECFDQLSIGSVASSIG